MLKHGVPPSLPPLPHADLQGARRHHDGDALGAASVTGPSYVLVLLCPGSKGCCVPACFEAPICTCRHVHALTRAASLFDMCTALTLCCDHSLRLCTALHTAGHRVLHHLISPAHPQEHSSEVQVGPGSTLNSV